MKVFLLIIFFASIHIELSAQTLSGKVISAVGKKPVIGANMVLKKSGRATHSDINGYFILEVRALPDTLVISCVGYQKQGVPVTSGVSLSLTILLVEQLSTLDEVIVNTGYYQAAKERATGSFTQINNNDINRSVAPNIVDRLEGITNGLQFDRRNISGENTSGTKPELRIRGISTLLSGSAPLLIVDNFPYDGDMSSINPDDVESVTILKDAAASSIWGARAGNGVIVINTKKGRYNQQTAISFNSSLNLTDKPDLFYSPDYLSSETVMGIQQDMFQRNGYTENDFTYLPAYVELLLKKRDRLISDTDFELQKQKMEQTDFRKEAQASLYQTGTQQQYAMNVSGGGDRYNYYFSTGYNKEKQNVIGNSGNRININFQNNFKINNKLELNAGIWYALQRAQHNGINYTGIGNGVKEPYTLLSDGHGNAMPAGIFGRRLNYQEQAESNKLLDWMYRPLDEVKLRNNTSSGMETRITGGFKYQFLSVLSLSGSYQYLRGSSDQQTAYDQNSYYARDLINTFTQGNGEQVIPMGGIIEGGSPVMYQGHSGRAQLNYNQYISDRHQLNVLAGVEINQQTARSTPGYRLYGYSNDNLGGTAAFNYNTYYPTLPFGAGRIPAASGSISKTNNRNLSYFTNGAYTYLERYVFSASARWDGSNLLGVKTNQKGTLLWSAGGSWEISREKFYPFSALPYFRIRATYGKAGLIDKSQSQYPTVLFLNDTQTQLPYASLVHPGNPSLRWEQVNTLNLAADWATTGQRISGSLEWYTKSARNLLGNILIDPTNGAGLNYKENYANMAVKGLDLQINSININREIKWESSLLFNYTRNKVTKYNTLVIPHITPFLNSTGKPPVKGRSADVLYSLPWNGLDHQTGLPVIYIDGQRSSNYLSYINGFKPDHLVVSGLEVPPYFGSVRNTFTWKGFQLSALISFKWGYVFRRTSMEPGAEFEPSAPRYHIDYKQRWKNPGDEATTNVPAYQPSYDYHTGYTYSQSSTLVTTGNHIRLQDINLSYSFKSGKKMPFRMFKIYAYSRNLCLLWKKNKYSLDPDYPYAAYPPPKTIAFGIQAGI